MPNPDRRQTAIDTAAALRRFAPHAKDAQVVLGFDGFVDSIISVVDKRFDADRYAPVPTIARLAEKIGAAAGKSSNYELVVKHQKLGGNGPIMANAMARAGLRIDYIGALGLPEVLGGNGVHPIFADFANIADLHPIAPPAATDALEFSDGKLMLGKLEPLSDVCQERIDLTIGREKYARLIEDARLLAMVNWSMCPNLGTVIDALADEVLPALAERAGETSGGASGGASGGPDVFIDLTDPEKRTAEDLGLVLDELRHLATMTGVYLGMNLKEAGQVAEVLGLSVDGEPELAIESTAATIRGALGLAGAVVHPRRAAAGCVVAPGSDPADPDAEVRRATFFGPFIEEPKLSTGAGDNFNAGFCLGLLAGLPLDQMLCAGTATSGYYVRHAQSPTLDELAAFCDRLPEPE